MLIYKLKQAGDTIVEVLIATAILGFVMGGAYAMTNKSLQTSQAAQERVEALKYVEGQLERLKYEARNRSDFTAIYRDESQQFCFRQTSTIQTSPHTDAACRVGPESRYRLRITYDNKDTFTDPNKRFGTFNIEATWDRLGGGNEQMVINYQT